MDGLLLPDGYTYSAMVKGIKGSVAKGYEDIFIKYAWDNFLIRTTKYQNINEADKQQICISFEDGNFLKADHAKEYIILLEDRYSKTNIGIKRGDKDC